MGGKSHTTANSIDYMLSNKSILAHHSVDLYENLVEVRCLQCQLTIDLNLQLISAVFVCSLTNVDTIIIGLHIDYCHLVPDFSY